MFPSLACTLLHPRAVCGWRVKRVWAREERERRREGVQQGDLREVWDG